MSTTPPPVALVSGGGRGLGRAIAENFLGRGYQVVVVDLDDDLLSWAQKVDALLAIKADLAELSDVLEVVRVVEEVLGRLDVLVNNAGILDVVPSSGLSDESWSRTLDVNLGSVIRMSRALYPLLLESEIAAIVNISSITAAMGFPGRLAYSASKAAIESVTRTLATEWGPEGIRVNSVAPGFLSTSRAQAVYDSGSADAKVRSRLTPLRRHGTPDELAATVAWLCTEATFVSGQVITVDGGFTVNAEAAVSR